MPIYSLNIYVKYETQEWFFSKGNQPGLEVDWVPISYSRLVWNKEDIMTMNDVKKMVRNPNPAYAIDGELEYLLRGSTERMITIQDQMIEGLQSQVKRYQDMIETQFIIMDMQRGLINRLQEKPDLDADLQAVSD